MKHSLTTLGTLLISALVTVAAATPATASTLRPSEPPMHERISAALAATPGGVQTGWNEISWDDGAVVLTLASGDTVMTAAVSGSNCAVGAFCVYSGQGYKGNKLTFTTCTSNHSVAGLAGGSVRSIANARSSGNVKAYNGSTLMLTVVAGTGKDTLATITKLSCS